MEGNALVTPIGTVEMHDGVAAIVLRIDLEAELAAQREHAILPFAEPSAADGDHGAVGGGAVPDTTAHAVARLQQCNRFSTITQPPRRRKSGKACAHDAVIRP